MPIFAAVIQPARAVRRCAIGVFAMSMTASSWSGGLALAQSSGQATDRGGFWGRPVAQQRDETPDRDAARLYADARAELDAGQQSSAQRRLEILVARYPLSPLADVARRELQRLYASALGSQPVPQSAPAAPLSSQRAASGGVSPLAPYPVAPVAVQPPPSGVAAVTSPPPMAVREASEDFRVVAGDRIFFADSSLDLGGRARLALEAQATWLTRYPAIEIVVEGHSDDHGSRDFNRDVAEKRAQAVRVRLMDLGVSAERVTVVAFGRDRPVADCAQSHCTAQNRRVVTVISRVPAGLGFEPSRTAGASSVPQR